MKFSTKTGLSLAISAAFLFGGNPATVAEVAGGFDGSGLTVPSALTQIMHLTAVGEAWGIEAMWKTRPGLDEKKTGNNLVNLTNEMTSAPISYPKLKGVGVVAGSVVNTDLDIYKDRYMVVRYGTSEGNYNIADINNNDRMLFLTSTLKAGGNSHEYITKGLLLVGSGPGQFWPAVDDSKPNDPIKIQGGLTIKGSEKGAGSKLSPLFGVIPGYTIREMLVKKYSITDSQIQSHDTNNLRQDVLFALAPEMSPNSINDLVISSSATSGSSLTIGEENGTATKNAGYLTAVTLDNTDDNASDINVLGGYFKFDSLDSTGKEPSTLTVKNADGKDNDFIVTGAVDLGKGTVKIGDDSTAGKAEFGSLAAKKVTVSETGSQLTVNEGLTATDGEVTVLSNAVLTVKGPTSLGAGSLTVGHTDQAGTASLTGALTAGTLTIENPDTKLTVEGNTNLNTMAFNQGQFVITEGGLDVRSDGVTYIGRTGDISKATLSVTGRPSSFANGLEVRAGASATFDGGLTTTKVTVKSKTGGGLTVTEGPTNVDTLAIGDGTTGTAKISELNAETVTITGHDDNKLDIGTLATINALTITQGHMTVGGKLTVNGEAEIGASGGTTAGFLTVGGMATFNESLTIHENSKATFNGGLYVKQGGLHVHSEDNLIVKAGSTIVGGLDVGEGQFKGGATFDDLTVTGQLNVKDGNAIVSVLNVNGTGNNAIGVKGGTTVGTLTVKEAASMDGSLTIHEGSEATFGKLKVAGKTEIGAGGADSKPSTLKTYDEANLGGDLVVHQNSVAEFKELTAGKSVEVHSIGDVKNGPNVGYGLTVENRSEINGDLKIGDTGNAGGAQFNHGLTVKGHLDIPWGGLVINDGDFIADQGSTNTVIGGGNHGVHLEVKKGEAKLGGNLTVNKHAAAIFSGGLALTGDGDIKVLSTGNTDVTPAGTVNYGLYVNGAAIMPEATLAIGEHGTDNGGKAIFMGEMHVGKVDMANKDNALIVGSSALPHSYKTEKNNFLAVSGRRTMKVNELDIANAPLISVGDSKSGANLYVNKVVKAYDTVSPLVIAQAPDDAVGTATIVAFNEGPYGGDFDTRVAVGKNAMVAFGFTAEQLHATGGLWSDAKDMAANGAFVTSKPLDLRRLYSSISVGLNVGSADQGLGVVRTRNNELHLESGSLAVLDIPNDLGRDEAMLTAKKFVLGNDGTKGRAINNDGDSEGARLYIQHDFYPSEEILVVKTDADGITINGQTFDESQGKLDAFLGENWTGDNLVLSSKKYTAHWASHPRGEKARSAGKSNQMWLSIDYKPTCELLPGVGSGTCHMIDDIYENGDSRDDNPGIQHIVDAVENLDHDTAAKVIEGATNIVAIAGVPTITNNIMGKVSGLVGGHSLERIPTFDLEGKKSRGGVWAMPFYDYNKTEGFKVSGGLENAYDLNYGGAALGVDYWFGDNLQAGAAVFAGSGKAKATGNFDRTDNDFDFFGASLYDTIAMGHFLFATDLGFTKVKNDIEQSIAGRDLKAKGVDSEAFTAGLTAYYAWRPLGELTVLPHAGARYTRINTDEAKVRNKNGADLYKIKTETQNLFQVPVGVKLTNDFTTEGGWDMTPSLDLGALFTMGDTKADGKVSIVGTRYSAATTADVVDKAALTAGVGFKAQKGSLGMELNYNALVSDHQTDHGVSATLHYLF